MSQPSEPTTPTLPPENVGRGTLYALPVLPVGVLVWLLLWSVGFLASILALGIALGGLSLYRSGSGGRVGRSGAVLLTAMTVVGISASFIVGVLLHAGDAAPTELSELIASLVFAVIFGGLGCFIVWRTYAVQSRAQQKSERKPLPGFENGPPDDRW